MPNSMFSVPVVRKGLFLLAAIMVVTAITIADDRSADKGGARTDAAKTRRYREGTVVNQSVGVIYSLGDRFMFKVDETEEQFRLLENLALERVAGAIQDAEEEKTWIISGVVTEFKGTNWLLVTRAIAKEQ